MINCVWDYIDHTFNEDGYIPGIEEVEEAVGYQLTLDGYEAIEEIIIRYISVSDMTDIKNKYEEDKNMLNLVFDGAKVTTGEVVLEENGYHYRSKEELIKAIALKPEEFAEMMIATGVVREEEVS